MRISKKLATPCLSLYVLGFIAGLLIWSPAGEHVGKQAALMASFIDCTASSGKATVATKSQMLIVLSSLTGYFSTSTFTNSNGTLAEVLEPAESSLTF